MDLQEKLNQVKRIAGDPVEWTEPDRIIIEQFESQLKQIELGEMFLEFPETQKIIDTIRGIILSIDESLSNGDIIKVEDLPLVNDLISRKKCYVTILSLFTQNIEETKKDLEEKLNEQL